MREVFRILKKTIVWGILGLLIVCNGYLFFIESGNGSSISHIRKTNYQKSIVQ